MSKAGKIQMDIKVNNERPGSIFQMSLRTKSPIRIKQCNPQGSIKPLQRNYSIESIWRCLWCNGYRRRKWTRRHEFKSWTRLIAFHIALIPLGKGWIQLFSLRLWVNSRADWFFSLGEATSQGEGKLWIQTCKTPLKKLTLCHILLERRGWVNRI